MIRKAQSLVYYEAIELPGDPIQSKRSYPDSQTTEFPKQKHFIEKKLNSKRS